MSARPEILLLIGACLAVTIIPRVTPLLLAQRLRLPPWAEEWLAYVPVAVIAALFVDQVLLVGDAPGVQLSPAHLTAGLAALALAALTRSITATVIGGMATFALIGHLLGA